jgi:hypothetical protein
MLHRCDVDNFARSRSMRRRSFHIYFRNGKKFTLSIPHDRLNDCCHEVDIEIKLENTHTHTQRQRQKNETSLHTRLHAPHN